MTAVLRFHFQNAKFNFQEQFTNFLNGITGLLLLPMFMFVLAKMWQYFNSHLGNYTYKEMLAYIGVTEILFMSFIRSASIKASCGDFSLSLARPRSWLAMQFSANFGRVLGTRILMALTLLPIFLFFQIPLITSLEVFLRLMLLLIPLGIIQGMYSLLLASAAVKWEFTSHLALPISKIFLVFGGVFAPISDFSEPARSIILYFPPADIFFQPAYFCVKGSFYQMSEVEWGLRVAAQILALLILNKLFFRWAKKYHQSFGG
jgi:ABC-type uncharacterized transport system permease subunit